MGFNYTLMTFTSAISGLHGCLLVASRWWQVLALALTWRSIMHIIIHDDGGSKTSTNVVLDQPTSTNPMC